MQAAVRTCAPARTRRAFPPVHHPLLHGAINNPNPPNWCSIKRGAINDSRARARRTQNHCSSAFDQVAILRGLGGVRLRLNQLEAVEMGSAPPMGALSALLVASSALSARTWRQRRAAPE